MLILMHSFLCHLKAMGLIIQVSALGVVGPIIEVLFDNKDIFSVNNLVKN